MQLAMFVKKSECIVVVTGYSYLIQYHTSFTLMAGGCDSAVTAVCNVLACQLTERHVHVLQW